MNAQTSLLNLKFESAAMLKARVQEYAKSEGFAVVTCNSNIRSLVLRCRHHGKSRNTRNLSDDGKQGTTKRKVVKMSMRTGCPWVLRATINFPYWSINEISGAHNHTSLGRNPMIYHQHRVLADDEYQKLDDYMSAKARNIVMYEALRNANGAPKMTMKVSGYWI